MTDGNAQSLAGNAPDTRMVDDNATINMGAAPNLGPAEWALLYAEVCRLRKAEAERKTAEAFPKVPRTFERWPRVMTLEAIPAWIKNFDRRCHALRLCDSERFQGARRYKSLRRPNFDGSFDCNPAAERLCRICDS